MFVLSCLWHLLFFFAAAIVGAAGQKPVPPQPVMMTKLVRLGTPRPKEALPRKAPEAPKKDAVVPSADGRAPIKPAQTVEAPTPPKQALTAKQLSHALARLRKDVAGIASGDRAGDSDVQELGDAYIKAIEQCLKDNYTVQGADPVRAKGRQAQVALRILADGKISDYRLTQSSGLLAMDEAVVRAIKRCHKVGAPPVALRERLRKDGIEILFAP